jgi:hypothetical protein
LNIERLEKTFGIAWILVKLHDATASDSVLESKVFFSTSEYAQVPRRATDLFLPLVQQLLQEWNLTLHAAENRLEMKVRNYRFALALQLTIASVRSC